MSIYKTTNDGYCTGCGVHRKLHQPRDYCVKGKGSKTKNWYCATCLFSRFGIDIFQEKTTWGENLTDAKHREIL